MNFMIQILSMGLVVFVAVEILPGVDLEGCLDFVWVVGWVIWVRDLPSGPPDRPTDPKVS